MAEDRELQQDQSPLAFTTEVDQRRHVIHASDGIYSVVEVQLCPSEVKVSCDQSCEGLAQMP